MIKIYSRVVFCSFVCLFLQFIISRLCLVSFVFNLYSFLVIIFLCCRFSSLSSTLLHSGNPLGDTGLSSLSLFLRSGERYARPGASLSSFSNEGDPLALRCALVRLDVSDCGLTFRGVAELLAGLAQGYAAGHVALLTLDLSHNLLGPDLFSADEDYRRRDAVNRAEAARPASRVSSPGPSVTSSGPQFSLYSEEIEEEVAVGIRGGSEKMLVDRGDEANTGTVL